MVMGTRASRQSMERLTHQNMHIEAEILSQYTVCIVITGFTLPEEVFCFHCGIVGYIESFDLCTICGFSNCDKCSPTCLCDMLGRPEVADVLESDGAPLRDVG